MNFNNRGYSSMMAEGFMSKVYGWMCAGLAVTASTSYYLLEVNRPMLATLKSNFFPVLILMLAAVGIIMYMRYNMAKLSYSTMAVMFLSFCAIEGIALAPVLDFYTSASVFYVFLIASAMFAVMAVYGWMTNSDLSSMGNILFMGLVGIIIANLINIFVQSAQFNLVISCFGVGIFAMLTAYDVQNLKRYSQSMMSSPEDAGKFALMGALSLFLNLINIFMYLLQLFGEQKRK
ncbi:MAG: Bax inhibitor-1/YccA family protein [Candidatus Dependentiae bacterium]|nr:Bax inhibitor-1/YccA family protein [Candidatus Dependentiae bacterium]